MAFRRLVRESVEFGDIDALCKFLDVGGERFGESGVNGWGDGGAIDDVGGFGSEESRVEESVRLFAA